MGSSVILQVRASATRMKLNLEEEDVVMEQEEVEQKTMQVS